MLKTKGNALFVEVMHELLEYPSDFWVRSWVEIQRDVGVIVEFASKKELLKAMFVKSSQL